MGLTSIRIDPRKDQGWQRLVSHPPKDHRAYIALLLGRHKRNCYNVFETVITVDLKNHELGLHCQLGSSCVKTAHRAYPYATVFLKRLAYFEPVCDRNRCGVNPAISPHDFWHRVDACLPSVVVSCCSVVA